MLRFAIRSVYLDQRHLVHPAIAAGLAAVLLAAPSHAQQRGPTRPDQEQVVTLTRVAERACDDPGGWSNLFFEGDPTGREGAVALFAELPHGQRVEIVQHQTEDGGVVYRIRSPASQHQHPLNFAASENGSCATVELPLDRLGTQVRVQVNLADNYVYGRIAEHREGTLSTRRGPTRLQLHPLTRSALRFDRLSDLQLFVDADRDGILRQRTTVDSAGVIHFSDEAREAFVVGEERFAAESLSTDGTRLRIRRVDDIAAPARGFRSPAFAGTDFEGQSHRLADHLGHVVIVEFWSTECPFSEGARPEARLLAAELEARGGVYLSMARESDVTAVRMHVKEHPRNGTLLVRDSASWEQWNPQTVTPLYYVIAPDGTILLRERGAAAVRLAAAASGIDRSKLSGPSP